MTQHELDEANARFWDHICGSSLADRLRDPTITSFDEAYLALYPWLEPTIKQLVRAGDRVLEIGPGYGTVGRLIIAADCWYWAIDIAPNVIEHTLRHTAANAIVGNVLELEQHFDSESFDVVIAIGCLHHTGNLPLALEQIHRVLKPGGKTLVMIYGDGDVVDYDNDGNPAPFTEWVPAAAIPELFSDFPYVQITERRPHDHTDVYVLAIKG